MSLIAVDYNPFAPHGPLNTTEPQREIIANILIGGDAANCSYNESVSLHLTGTFDFISYQKAVALLVSRHPALRSRFSSDGQTQTFDYNGTPEVVLADLSNITEERRLKELHHLLALEADIPFDLFNGPLFRFKVIRHNDNYHQLILSFHHVVCDGWSLGIIMQDLGKIYSALVNGGTYHEEPAAGYEQYVTEEGSFMASAEGEAVEKFWLDKFKDNLPSFEVPSDMPRPAIRTFNARRIDVEVDPAIVDAVKKAGAKLGASYVTTLTAAFEVFLHRITGSEDVVVGLPAAGQSATGLHALVGHCVNVLPLRTTVDPNMPFSVYLKKRKSELLDAFDHQRFTFGSLVRKLNIPRDPSRIPLIPVAFNLDIGITDGVEFHGCTYEFTTNPRHYENFEIFINASGSGNKLVLECTHNTDLYNTDLMQLRMEEFVVMLKGIASSPETANRLLPLLTESEQELIFNKLNSIDHSYDSSLPLHTWFEKTAFAYPGHIAISCEGQNMTYEELHKRSSQLAAWITSNSIATGSFIGILTHRHPDLIVAMLGILKAGCTYVPVDPNYPADRIHHILSDSKCPLVIVSASLKEMAGSGTLILCIDSEWEQGPGACLPLQPSVNVSPDSLAYIIYTSGSTGKPKGSLLEHRNVTRLFTATEQWYHFNDRDVWTMFHSAAFDFSVWEIWGALLYGGRLVIVPYNTSRDPKSFYELMKKEKVTVLNQTPSAFRTLTDVDDYLTPSERISSLRYIIFGGEALELAALKPWFRNHGDAQPQLVNMYGITETTVHVTYRPLKAADAASGEGSMIGIPIPDLQVYILDAQQHPVGIGVTGEMYVGGAGVGRGYLNRPDLTQQRFLPNEYNPFAGTPLYRSGDLARFHLNGDIEYLGRIDNQVKIRGFRIELGEIESVLAKHPDIRQAVVIAREDTPGDKRLVAYVVADQGVNTDTHQLREWIRKDLPDYMVPSAFVMMDKIPVTANGKTDRKALPKPEVNTAVRDDYEEPYTPTEEMLSTIWCNVLGVDRVGRKDNFFELGGHSLLGVKMFNEVERLLGARVHLAALFSAPTVEELARMITHEGSEKPWSCLVPLHPKGSKAPLFCIHMHNGNIHRWRVLKKHLGDDRPLYAIQPRGLDHKQQPHTTIEEMAEYYIGVMKEAQPQGPYNLLGLCFSGMVVYEMAVKLQERGEKVAFLGMVNNYAPPENPTLFKVKTEVNKFLKLDLGEKVKYVKEKQKSLGKRFFGGGGGVEEIQIDEPVKDKTGNDLRTIHSLALLHYHPDKVYNGNLWLFRNNEPIEEFFNEQLGWDRLVKGAIRCDVIDGCNNDTIITDEPYNAILSGHIRQHLDDVG